MSHLDWENKNLKTVEYEILFGYYLNKKSDS